MRNQFRPLMCLVFLSSIVMFSVDRVVKAQANGRAGPLKPPMAEKKAKTTNIHGETLVDEYFLLREKTNPAVMTYLHAENDYAEALMKPTAALQEKLYNEMLSHIKQTDRNVPYRWCNYFYYTRIVECRQYPIFFRSNGSREA